MRERRRGVKRERGLKRERKGGREGGRKEGREGGRTCMELSSSSSASGYWATRSKAAMRVLSLTCLQSVCRRGDWEQGNLRGCRCMCIYNIYIYIYIVCEYIYICMHR